MKIDHIYIITINNTSENYSDTLNRITSMGLPNKCTYEFRGVNGYLLSNDDLSSRNISVYSKWNLDDVDNDVEVGDAENKFWHRDITQGEIGCMLSHIEIWEDAFENGYDNILIFEDDVVSTNSNFDWSVMSDLDKLNYDLFYLGRFPQDGFRGVVDEPLEDYPHLCVPGYSYHSHAYMLSSNGISKLVNKYLPILKSNLVPADEFLPSVCNWTPREDLNTLFPDTLRGFGLTNWRAGVHQLRNEEFGNSLTEPKND